MSLFVGLTFEQKLILIAEMLLAFSVLTIVINYFFGKKKLNLKLSKGQVSYSQEAPLTQEALKDTSTGVFFFTLETVAMMTQIKTKLILHDQMTYLEERLLFIKNSVLDSYRRVYREKGTLKDIEDFSAKEYTLYKSLVELMKEDLKSNIRVLFMRNHFASYDDKELSIYLQEKGSWLITKMTDFLRELYPSEKMTIPFSDIEKSIGFCRKEIEEYLLSIFRRAAQIYNDRHSQIVSLETGLRDKIKETYGIDIDDRGIKSFSKILKEGEPNYERRS
jgi:hypothetical protein